MTSFSATVRCRSTYSNGAQTPGSRLKRWPLRKRTEKVVERMSNNLDDSAADRLSGARQPREPHDFDASYKGGTPPWDIGRPQPAFLRLAESGALRGRVLDVGCGTGEHALLAASLGLEAVGVDSAASAIAIAEQKARSRGLTVKFLVWNALSLEALGEEFDCVLDCGLFHCFSDEDRRSFVESLAAAVRPGGRYFMLCFSERQPGDWGPRRITQAEIRASFADGWRVDSIEEATLETNIGAVQGWLASITRG
jgi:2-polyprenyl-3-methyl-5-hydroxy-6-metoxy-1,4-benzoquinol methylase